MTDVDGTQRKIAGTPKNDQALRFARSIADRIKRDASLLTQQWHNPQNTKTRHFILDDLLPERLADGVRQAFPEKSHLGSIPELSRKKTFAKLEAIDHVIADVTDAFHVADVLRAVRDVVGIDGLEADPELYAGGISMMSKGDFLNPHIDNSHDSRRQRYRRLNLLYYISPDWQFDYGGNFELWDDDVENPKVILSKYNRLVVMETNRHSWHSVNPVRVEQKNRCCISNYYFSRNSPETHDYYHVTSFTGRPNQRFTRVWGHADNLMRQWIAVATKVSRGKSLSRFT